MTCLFVEQRLYQVISVPKALKTIEMLHFCHKMTIGLARLSARCRNVDFFPLGSTSVIEGWVDGRVVDGKETPIGSPLDIEVGRAGASRE